MKFSVLMKNNVIVLMQELGKYLTPIGLGNLFHLKKLLSYGVVSSNHEAEVDLKSFFLLDNKTIHTEEEFDRPCVQKYEELRNFGMEAESMGVTYLGSKVAGCQPDGTYEILQVNSTQYVIFLRA